MGQRPKSLRRLRTGAALAFALAWMAGCGGPSAAPGATGSASGPALKRDAAWGTLVVASPSPGATSALSVTQEDAGLVLKVDPAKLTTKPALVTYIVRRTSGTASQAPGRGQGAVSDPDLLHLESNADLDQFVMHVSYKRFYAGDYVVDAYSDGDVQPLGSTTFQVQ